LPQPAWVAPPPAAAPGAKPATDLLHFVAVHPQFAQNGLVFVSHLKFGERGNTVAISRGRFDGTTLQEVKEIFVADAWESSGNTAARIFLRPRRVPLLTSGTIAARIFFGTAGMLFLTVGDRDRLCCLNNGKEDNSLRIKAQALDNHV